MSSTDPLENFMEEYQRQIKAIAEEIRDTPVEVEVADGTVKVTALATGQLVDLYISARAIQRFDSQTLSEQVLAAVKQALACAGEKKLESFRPLIGDASSFNEIMKTSEGIARDMKVEEEEKNKRTSAYGGGIGPYDSGGRGRPRGIY